MSTDSSGCSADGNGSRGGSVARGRYRSSGRGVTESAAGSTMRCQIGRPFRRELSRWRDRLKDARRGIHIILRQVRERTDCGSGRNRR